MSAISSDASFGVDSTIERLISTLDEQVQEVDESLRYFLGQREDAILHQKRAMAQYEADMLLLEREERGDYGETEREPRHYVDPNIMRHLNVDKNSEEVKALSRNIYLQDQSNPTANNNNNNDKMATLLDMNIINKPLEIVDSLNNNRSPPTFQQKKEIRENMFITLEESTIEETRLELAYEEARERGDFRQAAELAEARYFLQRLHAERLQHLIDNYKPEFTSRTWGNDPEYALMVKQLNAMMNEPITSDGANTNQGGAGGGGKGSKKRQNKK